MVTVAQPPPAYGFWVTLMWGALALIAPFAVAAFSYQYFLHGDPALNVPMLMLAQVGSVVVVACALRLKRWDILDYVRLTRPVPRGVLLATATAIALVLLQVL